MTHWWVYSFHGECWVIVNAWLAAVNAIGLANVVLSDSEPDWTPAVSR